MRGEWGGGEGGATSRYTIIDTFHAKKKKNRRRIRKRSGLLGAQEVSIAKDRCFQVCIQYVCPQPSILCIAKFVLMILLSMNEAYIEHFTMGPFNIRGLNCNMTGI